MKGGKVTRVPRASAWVGVRGKCGPRLRDGEGEGREQRGGRRGGRQRHSTLVQQGEQRWGIKGGHLGCHRKRGSRRPAGPRQPRGRVETRHGRHGGIAGRREQEAALAWPSVIPGEGEEQRRKNQQWMAEAGSQNHPSGAGGQGYPSVQMRRSKSPDTSTHPRAK